MDIAVGLFTESEVKNGVSYSSIRWERGADYTGNYEFAHYWSKEKAEDSWLGESYFYRMLMSMRADNEKAIKFQDWLAFEVIPNIRKNGGYVSEEATNEQLEELRNKIDNFDSATLNNNRLSRKLKDFLEQMF
ncbi:MAG: hypothetical protein ACRCZ0_06615 [Cetobacterium sp.]